MEKSHKKTDHDNFESSGADKLTNVELADMVKSAKEKTKPLDEWFSKEGNVQKFDNLFAKAHQEQINQRLSKQK